MKRTFIFLLFLWDYVEFALTHEECSELPAVEHAFVTDEYRKAQYQKGDVIYFSCDPGFTTGVNTTHICTEGGWRAVTIGNCKDTFPVRLGCAPPPALENGYTLKNTAYFYVDGHKVAYRCNPGYSITGGFHKTCNNGQWMGDLQCQDGCDVGLVPDNVLVLPQYVRSALNGQSLQFRCLNPRQILKGPATVTCLENGQWSHPFPSCADPQSCGLPPHLDNAEVVALFDHNTRARYLCHRLFVMKGEPYKTCVNGVWSGEIKCLKPCVLDRAQIAENKIRFRFTHSDKLYVPHYDDISFMCASGATHDGGTAMRQRCNDGEVILPRCV